MTEAVKEYDCPECRGRGENMEPRMYPSGHTEVWVECDFCEGVGAFPEDIYLLLRLEGKV